jgi:hypothetical protein
MSARAGGMRARGETPAATKRPRSGNSGSSGNSLISTRQRPASKRRLRHLAPIRSKATLSLHQSINPACIAWDQQVRQPDYPRCTADLSGSCVTSL